MKGVFSKALRFLSAGDKSLADKMRANLTPGAGRPDETRDWLREPDAIELRGVHLTLGGSKILNDLSFSVGRGKLVCLLGPSGSGKSSILRLIAGLESPDLLHDQAKVSGQAAYAGQIRLHGQDMCRHQGKMPSLVPAEQRRLGYMFQDFALFPHMSVAQNVAFGLKTNPIINKGLSKTAWQARVTEMLEKIGLSHKCDLMPHALSGGQQQRVALARALAPKPDILLLDEPFSGLEQSLRRQLRDDFLHLIKSTGTTAIMVTHDPEEAMFMADTIALIKDGRVEQMGKPDELYFKPGSAFTASFFGDINPIPASVKDGWIVSSFGQIKPTNQPDGAAVELLIRPEGLKLCPLNELFADLPIAEVEASRMIGTASMVHLRLIPDSQKPDIDQNSWLKSQEDSIHLHAKIQGGFLPKPGERFGIGVNADLAYAFLESP